MARGRKKPSFGVRITAEDDATTQVEKIGRGLREQLGGAVRKTRRQIGGLVSGLTSLKGAAAGLGVALGARELVQFASEQATLGKQLLKTSERTGMSVEELQTWRGVAQQAGVDASNMGDLFEELSIRTGELAQGEGELQTRLEEMNRTGMIPALNAADSVGEKFRIAMETIRSFDKPAQRAAAASAFFSDQGVRLVNVAQLTDKEIAAAREEIRRSGTVTAEEAKRLARFKNAQNELSNAVRGLKVAIGTELLPTLRPYVDQLSAWIRNNRELVGQKIDAFARRLVEALKGLGDVPWGQLFSGFATMLSWLWTLVQAVGGVRNALLLVGGAKVLTTITGLVSAVGGIQAAFHGVRAAIQLVRVAMLSNPITAIALGIATAVGLIWLNWKKVKGALMDAWRAVKQFFMPVINAVKATIDAIVSGVKTAASWFGLGGGGGEGAGAGGGRAGGRRGGVTGAVDEAAADTRRLRGRGLAPGGEAIGRPATAQGRSRVDVQLDVRKEDGVEVEAPRVESSSDGGTLETLLTTAGVKRGRRRMPAGGT